MSELPTAPPLALQRMGNFAGGRRGGGLKVSALLDHIGPWTEPDYLALGVTNDRIELWDGNLLVTPAPNIRHQLLSHELTSAVKAAASAVGLLTVAAVHVRLGANRIVIPDLVVAATNGEGTMIEATDVRFVAEIVSPGNAATDRLVKMHLYAAAGIPWYLLVEPAGPEHITLRLHGLNGAHYIEAAAATGTTPLTMSEPFTLHLEPRSLLEG